MTNDYIDKTLESQLDAAAAGMTEPCKGCKGVGFLTKYKSEGSGEFGHSETWNEQCACNGTGLTYPYPDGLKDLLVKDDAEVGRVLRAMLTAYSAAKDALLDATYRSRYERTTTAAGEQDARP